MLKTFTRPDLLLGELQHAEEATVYHAGCSCQLLGDVALLRPCPFNLYTRSQQNWKLLTGFMTVYNLFKVTMKGGELNGDTKLQNHQSSRCTHPNGMFLRRLYYSPRAAGVCACVDNCTALTPVVALHPPLFSLRHLHLCLQQLCSKPALLELDNLSDHQAPEANKTQRCQLSVQFLSDSSCSDPSDVYTHHLKGSCLTNLFKNVPIHLLRECKGGFLGGTSCERPSENVS